MAVEIPAQLRYEISGSGSVDNVSRGNYSRSVVELDDGSVLGGGGGGN